MLEARPCKASPQKQTRVESINGGGENAHRESNVTSSCQVVERVSNLEFREPESDIPLSKNLEKIASREGLIEAWHILIEIV
jgi:hypothetical protein